MSWRPTDKRRPTIAEGETRNGKVSFAALLDAGESLTGTPTIEEEETSDLTITEVSVNPSATLVNHVSVPAARVVLYRVSGALAAHSPYRIKITVATSASLSQTLVRRVSFEAEEQ